MVWPIHTNIAEVFLDDITFLAYSFEAVPFWSIVSLVIGGILMVSLVEGWGWAAMIVMFAAALSLYYFRYGSLVFGVAGKIHGAFEGIPFFQSMGEPDPLRAIVSAKESAELISLIQGRRLLKKRE